MDDSILGVYIVGPLIWKTTKYHPVQDLLRLTPVKLAFVLFAAVLVAWPQRRKRVA